MRGQPPHLVNSPHDNLFLFHGDHPRLVNPSPDPPLAPQPDAAAERQTASLQRLEVQTNRQLHPRSSFHRQSLLPGLIFHPWYAIMVGEGGTPP